MIKQILDNIKNEILKIVNDESVDTVQFEIPKDKSLGDYSTNIAFRLAKVLKKAPVVIANDIVANLDKTMLHLDKVEVAGNGFINFFIDRKYLSEVVFKINEEKDKFGSSNIGLGKKVNIEFVSANPTGFLHVGHGRGASYGDSLARIMTKAGYDITKEHYVNDGGNQINNLAYSIYERYKEQFGLECCLKDDYYHGPEIITIAKDIKNDVGDKYLHEDWYGYFRNYGVNFLLDGLKNDLKKFNVTFDIWFSEKSLYDSGKVEGTKNKLIESGYTYEEDGALWLKTTLRGDEKDRVLVKSDKTLTYLTPDIAYHIDKLSRGYDKLIDVFGADHHGYINRLKAAIDFAGYDSNKLNVEILQMVRVIQDGVEVKMSKRSGKAITLRDLMDEVGTDALRYMYSSKALSTHMDLDLDLAISQTNDNPVYYVQYAYARICSLFRTLKEKNREFEEVKEFKKLDLSKAEDLVLTLLRFPSEVEEAAIKALPHRLASYSYELAGKFHSFYNDNKIITDDLEETNEILTLLKATSIVLKESLSLIGVGVKEKM